MRYTEFLDPLLIRGKPQNRFKAFTLVELLVTIAILGTIGTIAVPSYNGYIDRARNSAAIADIRKIELGITRFQAERGRPPNTLAEAGLQTPLDPWGRPYQYLLLASVNPGGPASTGSGGPASTGSSDPASTSSSDLTSNRPCKRASVSSNESSAQANTNNPTSLSTCNLKGEWRRDRFLSPLNTDFDLYSTGKDGVSQPSLTAQASSDDIVRTNNGGFVGLASDY